MSAKLDNVKHESNDSAVVLTDHHTNFFTFSLLLEAVFHVYRKSPPQSMNAKRVLRRIWNQASWLRKLILHCLHQIGYLELQLLSKPHIVSTIRPADSASFSEERH